MKYAEATKSNPILDVKNRYCQRVLESLYLPYLETKGFPFVAWASWPQDISKASTAVHETKKVKENFEIVERVVEGFCGHLVPSMEEQKWNFDNLIATLWGVRSPSEHSRFERNLLSKILMYYLKTSESRFCDEYSATDVNHYRDVIVEVLNMADLSPNIGPIYYSAAGTTKTGKGVLFDDSTFGRIQQVIEKPWKEIQQTYLKILSELRALPAIHLEKLFQIPSEVLYFCFQQQILRHLPIAIAVIEKSFLTTINGIEMKPEIDPETGEEWLDFKIRIKGEVEEVLDRYDKYTESLVSSLPCSVRYKMRLSYNII